MIPAHENRAHAVLSASGAHRWLRCTPSARLEEKIPDTGSPYAEEGTLAHELCELYLSGRENEADGRFDSEMREAAEGYRAYVSELSEGGAARIAEKRVDLGAYIPGGFGTCDCLLMRPGELTVVDFKYGRGVKVDAQDNPQLMLYALGALDAYDYAFDFKDINLCIYQPRLYNVSEWTIKANELMRWADEELKPKALLAYEGKGERTAGDHCRFCRCAATCAALRDYSLKDFDVLTEDLTPEDIAGILSREKDILAWLKSVHEYAFKALCDSPDAVPGFKLVEGRSQRRYRDTENAARVLLENGYERDAIFEPPKLIGIEKMTKLLGKTRFSELLDIFVTRPRGKITIAPLNDKRQTLGREDLALRDFSDEND